MHSKRTAAFVAVFITLVIAGASQASPYPASLADSRLGPAALSTTSGDDCTQLTVSQPGQTVINVPGACKGGLCQIMLWKHATIGAFGPGIGWPVYYLQDPADASWIGGPNLDLGGVSFSDGAGVNGDGSYDGIFLGGQTTDGSYVKLLDDSAAENSPDQWTIQFVRNSSQLVAASLYVCPLTAAQRVEVSQAGTTVIDVPNFCLDAMCGILMWNDGRMGSFGPGISRPVYYKQSSGDNRWIGGPNIAIGSTAFSAGAGANGNGVIDTIFGGGQTAGGGYVSLYDDYQTQNVSNKWSIEFVPASDLTQATYFIFPMTCQQVDVTGAGPSVLNMPATCVDGLCQIMVWNNANMGAVGPGIYWPAYYQQSSGDGSWVGGPNLFLAGTGYSAGAGSNGDGEVEAVYYGGTTLDGGYVRLYDDFAGESAADQWSIDFAPDAGLTAASYFICPLACDKTSVPIPPWRVLFDEAHDERNTLDFGRAQELEPVYPDWVYFGKLAAALQPEFNLERYPTGRLTPQLLQHYDLLLLPVPQTPFEAEEIVAIRHFVAGGGGLVVLGECRLDHPADALLSTYGIGFDSPCLFLWPPGTLPNGNPVVTNFATHPATAGVNHVELNWGQSLTIEAGSQVEILAWTDEDIWQDLDHDNHYDAGEPVGAYPVSVAYDSGCGRIAVFGDNAFQDSAYEGRGNETFIRAQLRWVMERQLCDLPAAFLPLMTRDSP